MKKNSCYIALALAIGLTMQPTLQAQLQKKNQHEQHPLTAQLLKTYRTLARQLRCMITGRECSPEEKRKIRRTALTIIALIFLIYKGARWWKRSQEPPLRVGKGPKWKSLVPKEVKEYAQIHKSLPKTHPNPDFAKNKEGAKLAFDAQNYDLALKQIKVAQQIASESLPK